MTYEEIIEYAESMGMTLAEYYNMGMEELYEGGEEE